MLTKDSRFWLLLAVFQVVFGVVVFLGTRHYYAAEPVGEPTAQLPEFNEQLSQITPEVLGSLVPAQGSIRNPELISNQANEYFAAKNYQNAAELYEELVNIDPRNADAYNNLGITLHYLGRSTEAIQWLEAGSSMDESNQRIWLTLGFVNKDIGNVEEARSALTKALEMGAETDVGESAARFLGELP